MEFIKDNGKMIFALVMQIILYIAVLWLVFGYRYATTIGFDKTIPLWYWIISCFTIGINIIVIFLNWSSNQKVKS